jgi:hypothetical protein
MIGNVIVVGHSIVSGSMPMSAQMQSCQSNHSDCWHHTQAQLQQATTPLLPETAANRQPTLVCLQHQRS